MVYIAYYTELNLQIYDYAQKRRICRENCKYAFDKNFHGFFLTPTKRCQVLPPCLVGESLVCLVIPTEVNYPRAGTTLKAVFRADLRACKHRIRLEIENSQMTRCKRECLPDNVCKAACVGLLFLVKGLLHKRQSTTGGVRTCRRLTPNLHDKESSSGFCIPCN